MNRGLAILFFLLACNACVMHVADPAADNHAVADDYSFRVIRDQVYTPPGWPRQLDADVYLPDAAGSLPAVLVVHGGGWERRSPRDMEDIARRLAKSGFVAVNIRYRFAPEFRFPAQLHDLQQAMQWMHANADRFRIDAGRIAGFGYSAGAHLVALLATVGEGDALDRPYGGPETRLKAAVAGGLPADLREFQGGRLVPQFLGATQEENFAVYEQASPVFHVTPDDPPMFLYHGGWDRLVPVDHAEKMYRALQAAGIESELYIDHGRGHVTMFLFDGGTVRAAIAFLHRHLTG